MFYRVDFSDDAEDDLKQLPKAEAERIKNKILFLETVKNPRKYLEKVAGKFDGRAYRYRVGHFRAYLTFKDEVLVKYSVSLKRLYSPVFCSQLGSIEAQSIPNGKKNSCMEKT